jgi:hypothetical protein
MCRSERPSPIEPPKGVVTVSKEKRERAATPVFSVMVDIGKATFEERSERHEARARFAMATQ